MAKANPKGVFCLECDWWNNFREPSSVEPILHLLDQSDTRTVRHVRRDVGTIAELEHWLKKFGQKACAPYKILYLGFHGRRGAIEVGDQRATLQIM